MIKKFPLINEKLKHFYHGADYNPEQWLKYPGIFEEDIRLMKLAKCNVMSIGIFSWVTIEPEEGVFNFKWLDYVLDKLYENGIYTILATPTGARPAWMAAKYTQVLRVGANRVRNLYGQRHNHCFTSPVYREKTQIINRKLAQRYSNHPGIVAWHISNEYGGDCHCDLCQEAFRTWLKNKYTSLDNLNDAWWTTFWSHTYTNWSQIESPAPHGEAGVHGLSLDWKRFVTDQTVDFCKQEIKPLKEINPKLPVVANLMELFDGLNYWKFTEVLDIVSWDNYPKWHENADESSLASRISMNHDIFRSLMGGKPFMLMESTPSGTNWQATSKLKKPGMHLLSSLQAVAHGSDTVQYFQWRKSRGSSEKFHGAVVDHCGHENTRVFKDVTQVGTVLEKLDEILGCSVQPEVAIIFDWENRWAINDSQGPRNCGIKYEDTVYAQYKPFWESGVPVDIIDMECDFSNYKLLVAPMLYMVKPGVGERIEAFVKNGGTFVATYWSGIVNENDLCFLGGFPGPLRKVLGIWSEEIESLYDGEVNNIVFDNNNKLGLKGEYETVELIDLIHAEGAQVLATYKSDFFAGRPALTVNKYGNGSAYYIASRNKEDFNELFYGDLIKRLGIKQTVKTKLPQGVTAQLRTDGDNDFIFLMNFNNCDEKVSLDENLYEDILSGNKIEGEINLTPYGFKIMKRKSLI
ncbi:beta-galactosidase [Clostridium estertheticum]|uniref:beta-galactosidase n=1 Tax=Clostridium estertheticum TaxID=238834 RepID=UPI001C7D7A23|nr:beta-galactosidase [Clostridium estertheticum]MBX4264575.1 beta-galactosidase [Clostridium estertheticum]WLC88717.1 beta-galactosidase [Clostridium estertheticum]